MEGGVLLALLGLCVGLAVGTQDGVLKDFDYAKFSGLWYEIAFASKPGVHGLPPKVEKMGAVVIKLDGDVLALITAHYIEDRCVLEKVRAMQGDAPGRFKVISTAGNKGVAVLATDYKTYAILDVSCSTAGAVQRVVKLYGRSLVPNQEALSEFHRVAEERGYSSPDVRLLEHDLTCLKALQSELI